MKLPVNIAPLEVPLRTVCPLSHSVPPDQAKSSRAANSRGNTGRPTRRERIVCVDMDGTIADLTKRKDFALLSGPDGSRPFYEVLLDGQHYHMDAPVEASISYLWRYVREVKGKIVYLSGRRQGTEVDSATWLRTHGFPEGQIIHRQIGYRSFLFKKDWLQSLRRQYWVDAHFGDRLDDDGEAARRAGIRFVHIEDHTWPSFDATHFR